MKYLPRYSLSGRYLEKLNALGYHQLFLLWSALALLFAGSYFLFATIGNTATHGPEILVNIENPWIRFFNSLYYSLITATSTGYGDITPQGFTKALAATQSISALFIFAIFVTKLVSHHQEIALRQVHRMTFEDVFHNIREGLFILRQDFSGLINKAEQKEIITAEDWDTLLIAFKQLQSLINEIPDFYSKDNTLYTIDERREELLQEAVHRSLHRLNQLLDIFSQYKVDRLRQESNSQELNKLVTVVERVMPLWQQKSPYDSNEAFMDIIRLKDRMADKIGQTIQV